MSGFSQQVGSGIAFIFNVSMYLPNGRTPTMHCKWVLTEQIDVLSAIGMAFVKKEQHVYNFKRKQKRKNKQKRKSE